jgi:hypothetical protein
LDRYGYSQWIYKLIIRLYTDALAKCRALPDALVTAPESVADAARMHTSCSFDQKREPGSEYQKLPPALLAAYVLADSVDTGSNPTQHIPFRIVPIPRSLSDSINDFKPLPPLMMNRMEHFRLYACTLMHYLYSFQSHGVRAREYVLVGELTMQELAKRVWDGEDIPQVISVDVRAEAEAEFF